MIGKNDKVISTYRIISTVLRGVMEIISEESCKQGWRAIFIKKNTVENGIPKARRYMLFNLSVSDTLTDEERALYNSLYKAKKEDKDVLRDMYHEKIKSYSGIRMIDNSKLYQKDNSLNLGKVIAGFENEAVRLCDSFVFDEDNPKQIPLIKEFAIMDCRNLLLLNQIIERGVMIEGQKYIVYSSSTNQQKNKQVCLMQEQFYEKNKDKLMCGLSLDIINSNEGCNTGKYLAYTSLIFSKSVESPYRINIDDVLVLPEFKTEVTGRVNYLDMDTQTIKETVMTVPVNHMDGAGMFLPGILPQSAQIRGGYIKGCVFPFDFRQFIIEKQSKGKISDDAVILDAWGNPVSISYIRDNIKVVLNDSQLKMRKYYASWDEYKQKFNENDLQICINNTLHYPTTDNPLTMSAYQFYQTIPRENMTDERIANLCQNTIDIINNYKTNSNAVLEILGVRDEDVLEPFHACIKQYPEMVYDPYVRGKVKSKIDKIRKKGMAGKPFIKGFYNYICPDLYAACEYWFCGEQKPTGLIPANYVYNAFYDDKNVDEVCCLRSPHLSDCEHGIRRLEKSEECKRWFNGMDTVISTHDLLVYTLVCDCDGDECLICHDSAFIDLLDREKLPLYYEMKKADPMEVNQNNIYECLKRSFENSQIGLISNALTKHLNGAGEPDLNFVRVMTAYNNFCIDHPKSQYMPVLKEEYQQRFDELSDDNQTLFPYFFQYAKGKDSKYCEEYQEDEKSNVNRISNYIMSKTKRNTDNIWKDDSQKKEFCPEYFQLQDYKVDRSSEAYKELQKVLVQLTQMNNEKFRSKLREQYENSFSMKQLGYEPFYFYCNQRILSVVKATYNVTEQIGIRKKAALYLLDIEYFQEINRYKGKKDILWNCFGDVLYENLCENLKSEQSGQAIKVRRLAYQSAATKQLEKAKKVEAVKEEIAETYEVQITKAEYDYVMSIPCRRNSEKDRMLLYLLLVRYKRKLAYLDKIENQESITDDNRSHFRIYKNARYGKVTRATLDNWLGKNVVVAKRGLERLEKKKLIKIVSCEKYDKIYPLFIKNISEDADIAFVVKNKNPMFDLYLNNKLNTKVKYCEICGKPFYAETNMKTCSSDCSRQLELMNKNKRQDKN